MAVYTVVAGGGNWNNVATWGGAGFPVAGDTANIDATLGVGNTVTVNVASACAILNLTNNNGTLAFGDFNITVTGDVTLGGTITAGTGGLTCTGTQTLTSGGITFPGTLTMTGTTKIKTLSGNWINTGVVTLSSGNQTLSPTVAETLRCNGGLNLSGANISGGATIIMGGGTLTAINYSIGNSLEFVGNVTFAAGNCNWPSAGGKTLTYTSGTITTEGSTILIGASSCTLDTDRGDTKLTFDNVTFNASAATITLASNLTMTGILKTYATGTSAFAGNFDITCGTLFIQGTGATASTLNLVSGRTLTITSAANLCGTTAVARTIKAVTGGTHTHLVYTGLTSVFKCALITITDVDATGSTDGGIDNWYGATGGGNTNVNIRTSADIGGGAGTDIFGWV